MLDSEAPLRIPFNRASFVGQELDYVAEAVRGGHISGDGIYTRKCQTLFGTITVTAPRISACPCRNDWGFVMSLRRPWRIC